ncbi:MAG TPA: GNAT family N-acetyltransferase [Longimicrobiales bacterium]|nr:GNAT family N-acetyltransferase [Longimicrobiales bacterium]
MIETARLKLIPATLEMLRAELVSPGELAAIARMDVAAEWPPELYDRDPIEFTIRRLEAAPSEAEWWLHYFVRKAEAGSREEAIGSGGYKGPPVHGTVEIGYSIVPGYRRQGYATEAAAGLTRHAFETPEVARVVAETLPELTASIAVLERCGFRFGGAGSEIGVVRYVLDRDSWHRLQDQHGKARRASRR